MAGGRTGFFSVRGGPRRAQNTVATPAISATTSAPAPRTRGRPHARDAPDAATAALPPDPGPTGVTTAEAAPTPVLRPDESRGRRSTSPSTSSPRSYPTSPPFPRPSPRP